jgi:hypothetical protein
MVSQFLEDDVLDSRIIEYQPANVRIRFPIQ